MSIGELVREFEWLSERGTPRVAAWAERHPALAECTTLSDVLTAIRATPDDTMRALMTEVTTGCPVAARVLVQALLPKMILLSRGDRHACLMDYVTHLWLRIIAYPLARRPHRIAANLTLDTLKAVRAERGAALVLLEPDNLHEIPARAPDPVPDSRAILRSALDRGLVDPHTHGTLAAVYAEGLTRQETAQRYRVTPLTVQRRCTRGLKAIAAHAHELVDAR